MVAGVGETVGVVTPDERGFVVVDYGVVVGAGVIPPGSGKTLPS